MKLSRPPGRTGYDRWSAKKAQDETFSLRVAGGGVLGAVGMALVLTVVAAVVVYFTSLDERVLGWVVNGGSFVVLAVASFLTARKAGKNGLLYGVVIGAFYALVTLAIGALLFPPFVGLMAFLKRLGFAILAGASGGILGVNS